MQLHNIVGRRLGPRSFVPEHRLALAPYLSVLGNGDARLLSTASDPAGWLVPPAMLGFFLVVDGAELTDELGFTWGKTLNLSIETTSIIPITGTDLVTGVAIVDDAYERTARDGTVRQFLNLRTDFEVEGRLAARWRVLFIERRDGQPDPTLPDAPSNDIDDTALIRSCRTPDTRTELNTPNLPEVRVGPFSRMDFARLVVAFDNPDPLHLDDAVAQSAGFPAVVGPGSFIVGLLAEPVVRTFGSQPVVWSRTSQRAPYGVGDELVARGCITEARRVGGRNVLAVATEVENGEQAAVAEAEHLVLVG